MPDNRRADIEIDVDEVEELAEDTLARWHDVGAPYLIEANIAVAARKTLDRANQAALEAGIVLAGVG